MVSLIQHFEADFLWKDSLKILNSGLILKTFTNGFKTIVVWKPVNGYITNSVHRDKMTHKNKSHHKNFYSSNWLEDSTRQESGGQLCLNC